MVEFYLLERPDREIGDHALKGGFVVVLASYLAALRVNVPQASFGTGRTGFFRQSRAYGI